MRVKTCVQIVYGDARCIHIYADTYTYICRHIYISIHICISVYTFTNVYVYTYVYTHLYMYIYIYVYIYVHIHIYIYMYVCVYILRESALHTDARNLAYLFSKEGWRETFLALTIATWTQPFLQNNIGHFTANTSIDLRNLDSTILARKHASFHTACTQRRRHTKTWVYCCNILQHAATRCNTLQHAATRCNTLQHAATN